MSRYVRGSTSASKTRGSIPKGNGQGYYGVDDNYGLEELQEQDDDMDFTKVYNVNDVFIEADDEEIERAAEEASLAARRLQLEIAKQDRGKASSFSSRSLNSSSGTGERKFWTTVRARCCAAACTSSSRNPKFLALVALVGVCALLVVSLSLWSVSVHSSSVSVSGADESVFHDEIESFTIASQGEQIVIAPPPAELETFCNVNSDGSIHDAEQCQYYCNLGKCCWEQHGRNINNNYNCFLSNSKTCPKYQVCKVLMVGKSPGSIGQTLIPAPKSLPHYCSEKSIVRDDGRQMCDFLCTPALCCIGRDGDCSQLQQQSCDTYNACRNVWSLSAGTEASLASLSGTADTIPLPLESTCKHYDEGGEQNTTASLLCEKICSTAMCCFTGSCLEHDAVTCLQYKGCPTSMSSQEALSTQEVPMPLNPLKDVCSIDPNNQMAVNFQNNNSSSLVECARQCAAGACCFGAGIANCYFKNEETCKLYEPCLTLPDLNDVPELPNVVDILCSPETVISDEGRNVCADLCKEASCCLADNGPDNCYNTNQEVCDQYRACSILTTVPEPPIDLFDWCCSIGGNNPSKCTEACWKASCCFLEGPGNCLPFNELTCESYNICRENVDFSTAITVHTADLSSPLETMCSTSSLQSVEGRIQCRRQCEPAECCIGKQGEQSCAENNKELCELYGPYCSNIWSSKDTNDVADEGNLQLSTIGRICSASNIATEAGKSQCEEECRPAACCDSLGAYNCMNDNQSWCMEYLNACKILNKPDK